MYADRVKAVLNRSETGLFQRLNSPIKIQDWLDTIPVVHADSYMSPRRVIAAKHAHCFEGALFAAAVLAFHGEKPLLLDLKSADPDVDHVLALFKRNGYWGAISKTNHPVLRWRDPIYPDAKTLALSFFHEYFLDSGKKTLRSYAGPFDVSKFAPERWVIAEEDLAFLVEALDFSRHFPLVPKKNLRLIRKATQFEIKATAPVEWSD